jgi:predicted transcriptional regulator
MTKFKTILRLASLGLSQRQIAQSCQVGQATISDYLAQAKQAQLRWPDIADWDEDRIQQALAPAPNPAAVRRKNAEPNFAAIRRELQVHKHLTLQLLWEV